jgi:hypothetical protein
VNRVLKMRKSANALLEARCRCRARGWLTTCRPRGLLTVERDLPAGRRVRITAEEIANGRSKR